MSLSTPVVVGTEGTLAAFAPHCHHSMGCLCTKWAPKCLLVRCHSHMSFLRLAGSGTLDDHSPRYTQSWVASPLILMPALPVDIKHVLVTTF
jgi:hypothetical protein